ncbi:hypothetical protein BT69DRAFT_1353725 [Atractiella rhizophila]|nr:hypothetical protein BT69DRAFT_1353725 [Atractiella rhizophila]
MATIQSLPAELLLEIFEILALYWVDERRDYTRPDSQSVWITTLSKAHIRPCSLVNKQWSELSMPLLDRVLCLSTANMDNILSFIRQSDMRRSHVKYFFVNFPRSSQESKNVNWTALWEAFTEILGCVRHQLVTLNILLWEMKAPPPEARVRLPSNLGFFSVRSSYLLMNTHLQSWFTGLEECKALRRLELQDVWVESQSSPALFQLSRLLITAILPSQSAFFSTSANSLRSLRVFRSDTFGIDKYPDFWAEVFKLLHLVKDTLKELDMDGRSGIDFSSVLESYIEPQLVAPILPRLVTLKLASSFLGNFVDAFPHLHLSSHLHRLKLEKVPIMSDAKAPKFHSHFPPLQRLTIYDKFRVSAALLRPVFNPITNPNLMQLDTSVRTFVSEKELMSFLRVSQPRMLHISLGTSFEVLNFLLTSGDAIPNIQEISMTGILNTRVYRRVRWENCNFDASDFHKGFCAAKRLQFKFVVDSHHSPQLGYATSIGDGGYGPLITFLRSASWIDQLESLTFGPPPDEVRCISFDKNEWSDYKVLESRLAESGTKLEVCGMRFQGSSC